MPPEKSVSRTFEATLERTADRLNWVIARVPFDAAKVWGKRGQLRIQGEINGFAFSTSLFPTGEGRHFFIVNKKMLSGGKAAPGLTAKFRLQPDTTPRPPVAAPTELLRELGGSKRLLKFHDSLTRSQRNEIARWIAESKNEDTRRRRARQMTERLMETLEAERDLPPIMQLAFRQNPRAREKWGQMSQSHRRAHLLAVFYYRTPESRTRRIAKVMEDLLGIRKKTSQKEKDRQGTKRQEELE
ncbi:MAG TPA: YdeI/OmpD-associated family protein [Candidatus Angelobacter sp.]|nr:YdeI/OmpD-associated family protein [Candidatus Angelobacter sp.]